MTLKISASAGSGKTYTLTRHFLEHLRAAEPAPPLSGCAPRRPDASAGTCSLGEIVAATFTNKAASEMKSRVISTLKETALDLDLPAKERGEAARWITAILRDYSSLNIRTIDSLLTTLIRLSALPLRLPPDFTPSFSPAEYFTPLYDALMQDLREGETPAPSAFLTADAPGLRAALNTACHTLVLLDAHKGFGGKTTLHDLLLGLVHRLLQDKPVPLMDTDALHGLLARLHGEFAGACLHLLTIMDKEGLAVRKDFLNFLTSRSQGGPFTQHRSSVYEQENRNSFDECLLKASQERASDAARQIFDAMCRSRDEFLRALPLIKHALQLAPLVLLAREIHARLLLAQKSTSLVPAVCLPRLASQALSGEFGASEAMCRLGARLTHVLLDEFQDTSREQWASLLPLIEECLATGGSLTYVGDVKQAIYSWRGGDATLFDEALAEPRLLAIQPDSRADTLDFNWRSSPAIVRFNNAFFSLLGQEDIAGETLSAMLPKHTPPPSRVEAGRRAARIFAGVEQRIPPHKTGEEATPHTAGENASHDGADGVHLYVMEGSTTAQVTALVRERLHELCVTSLFPRRQFRDVAILVRSGSEGQMLAGWLTEWGYPVVTENSFLLAGHPLISRLTAFLRFLDYPLDDHAFWEFIIGEECFGRAARLTRPELDDWLAGLAAHERQRPLYILFQAAWQEQWEQWIAPFYHQAGLMSAYDTLFEAMSHYRLFARHEDTPFLRRFLEIAHMAESQGSSSLAGFLAFWGTLAEDEKIPLPESMNAIRIMTMHKAKGLEFDVVIVPFHHDSGHQDEELTTTEVQGVPMLTRRTRELPEEYYPASITRALERLTLLYVAWTRPVHELHAFITRPRTRIGNSPLAKGLEVLMERFIHQAAPGLCRLETLGNDEELEDDGEYTDNRAGSFQEENTESLPPPTACAADEAGAPGLFASQHEDGAWAAPFGHEPPGDAGDAPDSGADNDPTAPWRPMNWLPRLKIYRSTLHNAELTPERRGTLAHLCLEHLVFSPASLNARGDARAQAIAGDVRRAVALAMRLFPLPLAMPEEVEASMTGCLMWFASRPEAPRWLGGGMRERSIMDHTGAVFRVDLLMDEGPDGLHAIDYKTGLPQEKHHEQVRRYMDLLQAAQPRPVRGTLVYLDGRALQEVTL